MPPSRPLTLLLIDANPDDAFLFARALPFGDSRGQLQTVPDAVQAIAYLSGQAPYHNREIFPMPECIILSWNLDCIDGNYLLTWLKAGHCRRIPVIVCSASLDPRDIDDAYRLGANSFVRKPSGIEQIRSFVQGIYEYWGMVNLPPPAPPLPPGPQPIA